MAPAMADSAETAADRAKTSFLAAIGHELRTPLNAIIGFSEIMEAELLGPLVVTPYRDYVGHILASARHLLSVIEDVLEISRAEAGELVLARREVDLATLVDKAVAEFRNECAKKDVTIAVELVADLIIQVDPFKFRRILAALISNAVKFSESSSVVTISGDIDAEGIATIQVRDEGFGIADSEIDHVFDQFTQIDNRISSKTDGSGLGLPLAKALVELHGGTIAIESELGVGTAVTVTLPAYYHRLAD